MSAMPTDYDRFKFVGNLLAIQSIQYYWNNSVEVFPGEFYDVNVQVWAIPQGDRPLGSFLGEANIVFFFDREGVWERDQCNFCATNAFCTSVGDTGGVSNVGVWIGDASSIGDPTGSVYAHEAGHLMGVGHSSGLMSAEAEGNVGLPPDPMSIYRLLWIYQYQ
jgi:hypothetical protein